MFNKHKPERNACQLFGGQAKQGYDWWWHSLTARHAETGEKKAFFIEYFLCNPSLGGDQPILGQAEENKKAGKKPSYLMVKAGAWGRDAAQLHRFFPWKDIQVDFGVPFVVEADDCFCTETEMRGHIKVSQVEQHPEWMCQNGEMSWNLKISKKIAFSVGYGASSLLRKLQLFEMFWHAEGMKTEYSGEILWNGEKYIVSPENCCGYADKNWGKNFTSPWLWLSSNNLTSKITGKKLQNSVFDIGGGAPKIGFIRLKGKLLSAYYHEGKCYEFNFSKFWTFTRTRFNATETDTQIIWHVDQRTWRHRMVADITCEKCDMLLVNYEAPDGMKRHNRLWNGGNGKGTIVLYRGKKIVDEVICENVGCEYGAYTV